MGFEEELNKRRGHRAQRQRDAAARQQRVRMILALILVAAIAVGVGILIFSMVRTHMEQMEATAPSEPETQPSTVPEDTVIHFVAGGDVNVTDKVIGSGFNGTGYDFSDTFLDIMPILSGADLCAVNFEGNLYSEGSASAPPELAQALKNAGVDMVQLANSRSLTYGLRGLKSTIQGIRAVGLEPLGAFMDNDEFRRSGGYTIRDIHGVRVAVVAFTKGMDGAALPAGAENCINLLYTDYASAYSKVDKEGINAILADVREEKPDIIIAMLHWGSEYNNKISDSQERIVELMLDGGVNAIIGTHSHYVQKMVYSNFDNQFVAYSLGDLLGDGVAAGTNYSVLLDLQITKNGVTGETSITGFDYVPVYLFDQTESGGGLRLLRIREAVTAYENGYVSTVTPEVYEAMKYALERIEARVNDE